MVPGYLQKTIRNVVVYNSDTSGITFSKLRGGDVDGNGRVNLNDAVILMKNIGTATFNPYDGDLNISGYVTVDDYTLLLSNMGKISE